MIEFDANAHAYSVDGVRIPSVTQIISWMYPEKYQGVSKEILDIAAQYGNRMHEWVETYVLTGRKKRQDEFMKLSTYQAVELLAGHQIEIDSCEKIVTFQNRYAGTYDMYGRQNEQRILVDIKTTAKLDEDALKWQLGMYKLALEDMGNPVDVCACLWLPKGGLAKLVYIEPRGFWEIDWAVYRYEQEHNSE